MHIYSEQETKSALAFDRLIEALRAGFTGGVNAPLRHHHTMLRDGGDDATMLLMPA